MPPLVSLIYKTPFVAAVVTPLSCSVWPALPIATVVALVLPILIAAVPAPALSIVIPFAAAEFIVSTPESAILFVENV